MGLKDFNNLCMGCMNEKSNNGDGKCLQCGYKEGDLPDSPLCLLPRTILNGQYLIGKVLGHGGFGITYLALDMNLGIKVAIKEYMPQGLVTRIPTDNRVSIYSGDRKENFENGLEKFLEEAQILAKFKENSCIVGINNFFKENGTAYFVMDYIEGINIKQYLNKNGEKLPYEEMLKVMFPVLDALKNVHDAGLLHRDISPDNIYMTSNGTVKLLDFGAARFSMGEQSRSLDVILKPGYAPEEQYRRKGKQGPWTDIYAVGATMYRVVSGIVPADCLDRIENDDLVPPGGLGIKLPINLERAIMKALSVKASDRYQTIDELQKAIITVENKDEIIKEIPVVNNLNIKPDKGKIKPSLKIGLAVIAIVIFGLIAYGALSNKTVLSTGKHVVSPVIGEKNKTPPKKDNINKVKTNSLVEQAVERAEYFCDTNKFNLVKNDLDYHNAEMAIGKASTEISKLDKSSSEWESFNKRLEVARTKFNLAHVQRNMIENANARKIQEQKQKKPIVNTETTKVNNKDSTGEKKDVGASQKSHSKAKVSKQPSKKSNSNKVKNPVINIKDDNGKTKVKNPVINIKDDNSKTKVKNPVINLN